MFLNLGIGFKNLWLNLTCLLSSRRERLYSADLLYAINNFFWFRVTESDKHDHKILCNGTMRSNDLFYVNKLSYKLFKNLGVGIGVYSWLIIFAIIITYGYSSFGFFALLLGAIVITCPIIQSNIFITARYHSASWIAYLLLLIGLVTDNTVLIILSTIFCMLLSSTIFFLASVSSLAYFSLYSSPIIPILTITLASCLHFYINNIKINFGFIINTFNLIGIVKHNKYIRVNKESKSTPTWWILFFGLAFLFCFSTVYLPLLTLLSITFFCVNQFLRFADRQTVETNIVLCSTVDLIIGYNELTGYSVSLAYPVTTNTCQATNGVHHSLDFRY